MIFPFTWKKTIKGMCPSECTRGESRGCGCVCASPCGICTTRTYKHAHGGVHVVHRCRSVPCPWVNLPEAVSTVFVGVTSKHLSWFS